MSADDVLRRQVEYFRSDEHVRERAAVYRGRSPADCWAETIELCANVDWFLERMEPDVLARVVEPEPRSPELIAILEAMQRQA